MPKTIGAMQWQRLATFTVHSLRVLMTALAPFVWMSQHITKLLKHGNDQPVLTRTDFAAMASLGAEEGVFEEEESHMIRHLLQFKAVEARDVMTPRTVVAGAKAVDSIVSYYANAKRQRFSRIPLYGESKDHITGYVLKAACAFGEESGPYAWR